jgi:hypothetical protein
MVWAFRVETVSLFRRTIRKAGQRWRDKIVP